MNKQTPDSGEIVIDQPVGYKRSAEDSVLKAHDPLSKIDAKKDTKLIFKDFIVKLHSFNAFNKTYGVGELNYNGDTSQVVLNVDENDAPIITAKKDSVKLDEDPESNLKDSFVEIIPKHKSDRFRFFYSFQVALEELIGNTKKAAGDKNKISWVGMMEYKQLKDSLGYFIRMPEYSFNGYVEKEIKSRLNLRDSLVAGQHNKIATLIYKKKPCVINPSFICLRVERFDKNKRTDTKFIIIVFHAYD